MKQFKTTIALSLLLIGSLYFSTGVAAQCGKACGTPKMQKIQNGPLKIELIDQISGQKQEFDIPLVNDFFMFSAGKNTKAKNNRYIIKDEDGNVYSYTLWEDSTIPYEFSPTISIKVKNQIKAIIKYFNKLTNVCWVERESKHTDFVQFKSDKISSLTECGWSTTVGKAGGMQFININPTPGNACKKSVSGTIFHEMCHAIGLFHEHQKPSRDQYIKILPDNICDEVKPNYKKYTQLPAAYLRSYSYESIMHYSNCAGSKTGGYTFEILSGNPVSVGIRNKPSWGDIGLINSLYPKPGCKEGTPSLFLIDVSGSMAQNNKLGQARQAALNTLQTIKQEAAVAGEAPHIGVMTFAGGCSSAPTEVQPFTQTLTEVENSIARIIYPGGGTPLPSAVAGAKQKLEAYLIAEGQTCGELIILGDGQSSCGNIRPPEAYAGVMAKKQICERQVAGSPAVTFYTIGFDIPPGSVAERDLQFLAMSTGGKYFSAKNEQQLTRAFQKINRIFIPIRNPQIKNIKSRDTEVFYNANSFIYAEQYDSAFILCKKFVAAQPTDSSGLYNLALMCEANERYKSAVKYYEKYLEVAPNAVDRIEIEQRIITLKEDYAAYLLYMKQILESDIGFLELHYQQLLRTPDAIPLAGEFSGYIKEKYDFYGQLPEILEMDTKWVKNYSKEISQAFGQAKYYLDSNPPNWDMDGIAMVGNIYYPLERLVKKMGQKN